MERYDQFEYRLVIHDIESNNIGDAGCEYLSKANWKKLTYLNISIFDRK